MNYVKIQRHTGRNQGKESWSGLNFVEKLKGKKKKINIQRSFGTQCHENQQVIFEIAALNQKP